MTLNDWCRKWDVQHTHPTTERGAISVIPKDIRYNESVKELFELSDYRVAERSLSVFWLLPRVKYRAFVLTGWDKEYTAIFTDVIQASDWTDKIIRLVTRRCVVATWISEVKQNAI